MPAACRLGINQLLYRADNAGPTLLPSVLSGRLRLVPLLEMHQASTALLEQQSRPATALPKWDDISPIRPLRLFAEAAENQRVLNDSVKAYQDL